MNEDEILELIETAKEKLNKIEGKKVTKQTVKRLHEAISKLDTSIDRYWKLRNEFMSVGKQIPRLQMELTSALKECDEVSI